MKRLYIDYELCNRCPACVVSCSYIMHPGNNGITCLREAVAFLLVCRRCEEYPCVNACPTGALKRDKDTNHRAKFVCVSCKTCSLACPFGTILPEVIPYVISGCDYCLGRLRGQEAPACVGSCPYGALKHLDDAQLEGEQFVEKVGENLAVRVVNWLNLYGVKK